MNLRECKICLEEFEPKRSNARFCSKDHYRPCKQCNKEYFVKKVVSPPECCSAKCAADFRTATNVHEKHCKLCGDEFTATNNNSKYCEKEHYKTCKKCQKEFLIKNPSKIVDFCSRDCSITGKTTLKKCKRCSKEFQAIRGNVVYCDGPHYAECEGCGKRIIEKQAKRVTRFCSISCSSSNRSYTRTCILCGDVFTSGKSDAKFCLKKHTKPCENCGKDIEIDPYNRIRSCSKHCAAMLIDYNARNKKSAKTMSKKYGIEITNASQIPEIREKKRLAAQKKYGFDNVSQAPEVQEKRRQTNLKKYGIENSGGAPEVQEKIRKTNLEKYGVENVFQAKEVKAKIRATLQERYGADIINPIQVKEFADKAKQSIMDRFGVESMLSLPEVQLKSRATQRKRISKLNRRWKRRLEEELGIEVNLEVPISNGIYIDLEVNGVFIDINPTVTHNSTISFVHTVKFCTDDDCVNPKHLPIPPSYHQDRFLAAEAEGKTLLQYFDWYDEDKFISIIRSKLQMDPNRIGARQTVLKEISQRDANLFFKENHLLGSARNQKLCLGLFYNDELVHCQTYGPARLNKNFEWEAIRSASKMDWHIQGGFSKCDKHFFKTMEPESVISYVDLAISTGSTELKFPGWRQMATNKSSAMWVNVFEEPMKFIKASSAWMLSADRLLGFEVGDKYPSHHPDGQTFTNDDVLLSEGFLKIYDPGTRTFIWHSE